MAKEKSTLLYVFLYTEQYYELLASEIDKYDTGISILLLLSVMCDLFLSYEAF
jgi:hypothetical protein